MRRAAFIITIVALFGLLLSITLIRRADASKDKRNASVPQTGKSDNKQTTVEPRAKSARNLLPPAFASSKADKLLDFDASDTLVAGKLPEPGDEENDDDLPAFMHGKISREEYLLARENWVNERLGMTPGLVYDPMIRSRAIEQMTQQREVLRAKAAKLGTNSTDAVDYPDFAHAVARAVGEKKVDAGIIIDGAGIGSAMTANKVPNVRAAACYNIALAKNSREHNGANVLTLGSGQNSFAEIKEIVEAFLTNEITEERHKKRVVKIDAIEKQYKS